MHTHHIKQWLSTFLTLQPYWVMLDDPQAENDFIATSHNPQVKSC